MLFVFRIFFHFLSHWMNDKRIHLIYHWDLCDFTLETNGYQNFEWENHTNERTRKLKKWPRCYAFIRVQSPQSKENMNAVNLTLLFFRMKLIGPILFLSIKYDSKKKNRWLSYQVAQWDWTYDAKEHTFRNSLYSFHFELKRKRSPHWMISKYI